MDAEMEEALAVRNGPLERYGCAAAGEPALQLDTRGHVIVIRDRHDRIKAEAPVDLRRFRFKHGSRCDRRMPPPLREVDHFIECAPPAEFILEASAHHGNPGDVRRKVRQDFARMMGMSMK